MNFDHCPSALRYGYFPVALLVAIPTGLYFWFLRKVGLPSTGAYRCPTTSSTNPARERLSDGVGGDGARRERLDAGSTRVNSPSTMEEKAHRVVDYVCAWAASTRSWRSSATRRSKIERLSELQESHPRVRG